MNKNTTNTFQCPQCQHDLTPRELGQPFARLGRRDNGFWAAKLTRKDAGHIRKSKEPIRVIAEKYNACFPTRGRIMEGITYTGSSKLDCPHCDHKIQPKVITVMFARYVGQRASPAKAPSQS